jgi:hypothetical protein
MIGPCWIGPGILKRCYVPRGSGAGGPIAALLGLSAGKEAHVATPQKPTVAEIRAVGDVDLIEQAFDAVARVEDDDLCNRLFRVLEEAFQRFAPDAYFEQEERSLHA